MPLFLLACSVNPRGQTEVAPTGFTKTVETASQVELTTLSPTNTVYPNIIRTISPDDRYTIELDLSETPVKLTILDNTSKQRTQIPITHRYYNRIVDGGPIGFKWSVDNKILMFVLYREPFSNKREEDSSSFFAINVEHAKAITANYSVLLRGLRYQDKSGIATLEHGGLNNIDDFYFSGTNCYKATWESECESSYVSPSGNWEFSQWEENSSATLTNLAGNMCKYSYPATTDELDYIVTFVQRWADDENYVLFSPANWYGSSIVYGLFQMNLANCNVSSLLGNDKIEELFYLSVSPHAEKAIYITSDKKAFIKNLNENSEKSFNISFGNDEVIANFIWSPDEKMAIFARLKLNEENKTISADYLRLDTETGDVITLAKDKPEYLNVIKITNSEVSFEQETYSLVDGMLLK